MGKSLFEVWGQTKNVKNKGRGDVGVCVFFFYYFNNEVKDGKDNSEQTTPTYQFEKHSGVL